MEIVTQTTQLATGASSKEPANWLLSEAAGARGWSSINDAGALMGTLAILAEFEFRNSTETMLGVNMLATRKAALRFLYRATMPGQSTDGIDANVNRATRLMRLFNEELEVMQKLKAKASQQKVTVEHVHVYEGGQAIVGAVEVPKMAQGRQETIEHPTRSDGAG